MCEAERFGHSGDGGWWLCTARLKRRSCVIFSFGVGFDPTFETAAASRLSFCRVVSFDPTPIVGMALTAIDAEWQHVSSPTACSIDAPQQLAQVACALKASSSLIDSSQTLRALKPQYDAQ